MSSNEQLEVIKRDLARNARPWYNTDIKFLLDSLTRAREEAFDEAIAAATTAFDKQPGDSKSYHDNTMVNASAMERRVKQALEAARDNADTKD